MSAELAQFKGLFDQTDLQERHVQTVKELITEALKSSHKELMAKQADVDGKLDRAASNFSAMEEKLKKADDTWNAAEAVRAEKAKANEEMLKTADERFKDFVKGQGEMREKLELALQP